MQRHAALIDIAKISEIYAKQMRFNIYDCLALNAMENLLKDPLGG